MNISENGTRRSDRALSVLRTVQRVLPEAEVVAFGSSTYPVDNADTMVFRHPRTDISQVVHSVSNRSGRRRPGVALLITDGQYNSGESPLNVVRASKQGWYAIGIGDTAYKQDVALSAIQANDVVEVGRKTHLSATVTANGFRGRTLTVLLEEEGRVVGTDSVTFTRDREQRIVHCGWTPQTEGMRKVTLRIMPLEQEAFLNNHAVTELVDVRSDRRTIVVFAGAPSPDLSFIKTDLERSTKTKVKVYVEKQGSEYYGSAPTAADLADADACVLIGYPIATSPQSTLRLVASACQNGLGLLFVASKDVDYDKLKMLEPYLPFSVVSSRPNEYMVTPDVPLSGVTDPLMKISGRDSDADLWNALPPVYRTETYVSVNPGTEVLATVKVNNVPLPEAMILRRNNVRQKSAAILAYGIHRWRLLGTAISTMRSGKEEPDVLTSLLENVSAWLTVDESTQRIRVRPTRTMYDASESVAFVGNVLDERFLPVSNAEITVKVNGGGRSLTTRLSSVGAGRYTGTIGVLAAGDYTYAATVFQADRKLHEDRGRFTVNALSLEETAVVQNTELLKTIALQSDAMYGNETEAMTIAEKIASDQRLQPRAITEKKEIVLWHTVWPLIACILFFGTEWGMRKKFGML